MRNLRPIWVLAAAALVVSSVAVLMLWEGPATAASNAPASNDGKGGSVWGANYFPNVPLITHDGRTVHFFDDLIKDKVVAINFIYTTCPDACPMETARLLEVKDLLGDRVGKDVFFYSITIDPEHDTQPVLQEYVDNWQTGEGWTFLTGKEEDITLLRRKLGIYIEEIQSEDSNDHNLSLVIGNQSTGRWMKRSPYENPYVLATQLGSWLHNWKIASTEERNYADAPELRKISTGELVFRTRCASCHTVGEGDIVALRERRIGPDLYNITAQRDREWLVRWLLAPDKMLADKDPLATALLAQYKNVPMPNLRLTPTDVENLLSYIEQESRRHERHMQAERRMEHMDHMNHQDHMEHMNHGDHHAEAHAATDEHAGHADHGDHRDHGKR